MPLLDLLAGESDRLVLGGDQRLRGLPADGLNAPPTDDAEPGLPGALEQRILGVRERRAEHHRRGRTCGDAAVAELDRGLLGEFRIFELALRGKIHRLSHSSSWPPP